MCVMLLGAVLEGGGMLLLLICVGDCVSRSLLVLVVDGLKLGTLLALIIVLELALGGMLLLLLLGRTLGSAAAEAEEPESSSLKDMVGAGLASITLVLLLLG